MVRYLVIYILQTASERIQNSKFWTPRAFSCFSARFYSCALSKLPQICVLFFEALSVTYLWIQAPGSHNLWWVTEWTDKPDNFNISELIQIFKHIVVTFQENDFDSTVSAII